MTDNPYRPGAAQLPPYLAGRDDERQEFSRFLKQSPILDNLVLTGIRGVGKTVLMREAFRKEALKNNWIWVTSDISEAVSVSENHIAQRLMADLNTFSGDWVHDINERRSIGFSSSSDREIIRFDYDTMRTLFDREPGLASDKIKRVFLEAWKLMQKNMPDKNGIIFAWDEAQNLADRSKKEQYPLGVLLDLFSSLQSQGVPFMLLLTGLPTLFPKLVESRTYAERMFHVITLRRLSLTDSRKAILEPLIDKPPLIHDFFRSRCDTICKITKGYPYFIQFWCRELYDYLEEQSEVDQHIIERIIHKLDMDFFDNRWVRLTDRQQDLLTIISYLENSDGEFTVQDIVKKSKSTEQAFSSSHVNQMLVALFNKGMVFKSRHGKYSLAVPLLDEYIRRRTDVNTPFEE